MIGLPCGKQSIHCGWHSIHTSLVCNNGVVDGVDTTVKAQHPTYLHMHWWFATGNLGTLVFTKQTIM